MSELDQRPEIKKPPLERQKSKDLHVNFLTVLPEKEEEGKKYLTAKFGRNEMSLIRKRLEVENWISDKLNELYKSPESPVEIDLDKVLSIEKEEDQRQHLKEKLKPEEEQVEEIDKFIASLLEKLKSVK